MLNGTVAVWRVTPSPPYTVTSGIFPGPATSCYVSASSWARMASTLQHPAHADLQPYQTEHVERATFAHVGQEMAICPLAAGLQTETLDRFSQIPYNH